MAGTAAQKGVNMRYSYIILAAWTLVYAFLLVGMAS